MLEAVNFKDNQSIKSEFRNLCREAFPKYELPPLWILEKSATKKSNVNLLCYYRQIEGKKCFVGLSYTIEIDNIVNILLLAVSAEARSLGIGTEILSYLKKEFTNKILYVTYEILDKKSKNYDQRVKRVAFYERNGFHQSDVRFIELFSTFQVAATENTNLITLKHYRKVIGCLWPWPLNYLIVHKGH